MNGRGMLTGTEGKGGCLGQAEPDCRMIVSEHCITVSVWVMKTSGIE